jgi:hypothetical protein
VKDYLATYPKSGVPLQGTDGIRKLRLARSGKGKRGGVRVNCYFHNHRISLYLLTVFGKGEKESLSKADRNELAELAGVLKEGAGAVQVGELYDAPAHGIAYKPSRLRDRTSAR